ncbi:RagB/SusD family nutrient uptake outer membrane protein [Bacteroides congonensis]|jgi:hypothetical protein|uniref:RagB/SusD family nutrient uptake outer membrane protein n=1 Tax=Bacteroides congonensis TaxID=1871006 RepID=UPI0018A07DE4|nr:RagB/SusD family nutrient uptake outer membrane protein [Bacteroides congonensis]
MKKYTIYSFLLLALFVSGCSSSFLDQEPPLDISEGDIFSSKERIQSTLRGLYGTLKNTPTESFMGGKTYLVFDNRGDDIINKSENLSTLYDSYLMNINSTSTENTTTWTNAYWTINNANVFLEGLEGAKDLIGDDYDQFKAEAKFVRALCYYYLNNLYSQPYSLDPNAKSVPLRLTPQKGTDDNNKPRSTVKAVYEQILEDLKEYNSLPNGELSETGVSRATKGAANMLRMRVYMAMENWGEAITAGELVTGYSLAGNVASLFKTPYYTTETIFSLPMAISNTPNTQQGLAEYYADEKILIVDDVNGIMSKANYSLPDDARSAFKDAKKKLVKFTDVATKLDWVPIFRYAETLLDLAECYANTTGGEGTAKELLKRVRYRSLPEDVDPLDIDALSGDGLKEAIYNEKRLEFIGEGIRGIDIIRRGENFVQGKRVTSPQNSGYIWPIPQAEQLINKDLNK